MKSGWLALATLAGLLIPAQAAMNARMRTFVVNPAYSALVNFTVGGVALLVALAVMVALRAPGDWRNSINAPWWAWCGGLIGALFVLTAILVVPRIGSATFTATILCGQLLGALVLDHYGALGLPQHAVSPSRVGGALLLLVGLWLIQRG